jgi:hypothetical protein
MVQKITKVRFTVTKPIELPNDIVLRHGAYWGVMEREGYETNRLGKPSYYVDLSTEQLARMGQQIHRTRNPVRCDLTKFVEKGLIEAVEVPR